MEGRHAQCCHDEELFNILSLWYRYSKCRITLQDKLSSVHILTCWKEIWFAKGDLQVKMDEELEKYESCIEKFVEYKPNNNLEAIALIILYDQVTRNIFRGTPRAYEYDHIAFNLAKEIVSSQVYMSLGLHFKLTVLMSFVHSEDKEIHNQLESKLLPKLQNERNLDPNLYSALNTIALNHRERINLFGRIPERVRIRGEELTAEEKNYLSSIY